MNEVAPALSVQKIIDIGLEENIVPDGKFHYQWYEYQKWQMDILIFHGLLPHHYLLDFGCGAMRLGMKAVEYLDNGHYYGVDIFDSFLRFGARIMETLDLKKDYCIKKGNAHDLLALNQTFDFGMAQSVFTHMHQEDIHYCLKTLKQVFRSGGKFIFTLGETQELRGFVYNNGFSMISGGQCRFEDLFTMAKELGISLKESEMRHFKGKAFVCEF